MRRAFRLTNQDGEETIMIGGDVDLTGMKFCRLTVLEYLGKIRNYGKHYWLCKCDCGTIKPIESRSMRVGTTLSCGCYKKERDSEIKIDLTGKRFGRLVALYYVGSKNRKQYWMCRCDCGNEKPAEAYSMKIGTTISCGCYHSEQSSIRAKEMSEGNKKHGHTKKGWCSRTYKSYDSMKRRCLAPNDTDHQLYKDKDITICDRWLGEDGFTNFLEDMGERPEGKTLDRIDNSGIYSPENCRWATIKEQLNNTDRNHSITYKGETKNLTEWCRQFNIAKSTVINRLNRGWSVEQTLTTPVGVKKATDYEKEREADFSLSNMTELRNKTVLSGYEGRTESSTKA